MECAAGTDVIKVSPKGCKPVSEDRCASGFMAPAENITFPDDPLETCCKCKAGEACKYCIGAVCTEDEKKMYVTTEDCFIQAAVPVIGPAPSTPSEPEPSTWDQVKWLLYATVLTILLISVPVYVQRRDTLPLMVVFGVASFVLSIMLFVYPK